MSKERKRPTIVKPAIDYATVLQFAAAGESPSVIPGDDGQQPSQGPVATVHKGQVALTVELKEELHAALQREAARKGRTVEDWVRKILAKHCKGD
jgi:hypothetical protein